MPVDRMFHPTIGDSEKIALLTDGEFRVWFTYNMAADDFGVLPMLASKLKGADRALSQWPTKRLDKALQQLVDVALVRRFEAQKAGYIWTPTWQWYQKIRYPRREQTHYPAPPEAELIALDEKETAPTRALFATFHIKVSPEFRAEYGDAEAAAKITEREQKRSGVKPRRSGDIPGMDRERSGDVAALTRAGARETAHGLRPTAHGNGSEGGLGETEPGFDVLFNELCGLYPQHRVSRGLMTQQAFVGQLSAYSGGVPKAWALMKANLSLNNASHEWRMKGMAPSLQKYLQEGLWLNVLPADPPVAEQLTKGTSVTAQAMANALRDVS